MKVSIIAGVVVSVTAYFVVMVAVVPSIYLDSYSLYPQPVHSVTISDDVVSLGESFILRVDARNNNDFAEYVVTTVGLPALDDAREHATVVGYDFVQAPGYVEAGDPVPLTYGTALDAAPHAYIISRSTDATIGAKYHVELAITPPDPGTFIIHVKTAALPHADDLAHFPHSGFLDAQGELADVYEVAVLP